MMRASGDREAASTLIAGRKVFELLSRSEQTRQRGDNLPENAGLVVTPASFHERLGLLWPGQLSVRRRPEQQLGEPARVHQCITNGWHVVHVPVVVFHEEGLPHQVAQWYTQHAGELGELVDPGRLPRTPLDLRQPVGAVPNEPCEHRLRIAPALAVERDPLSDAEVVPKTPHVRCLPAFGLQFTVAADQIPGSGSDSGRWYRGSASALESGACRTLCPASRGSIDASTGAGDLGTAHVYGEVAIHVGQPGLNMCGS